MHFVYILYSEKLDKFYIGQTRHLAQRVAFHNDIFLNKIWTKRGIPWKLIFSKEVGTRAEAMKLEKSIKNQKSRKYIAQLIKGAADPDKSG